MDGVREWCGAWYALKRRKNTTIWQVSARGSARGSARDARNSDAMAGVCVRVHRGPSDRRAASTDKLRHVADCNGRGMVFCMTKKRSGRKHTAAKKRPRKTAAKGSRAKVKRSRKTSKQKTKKPRPKPRKRKAIKPKPQRVDNYRAQRRYLQPLVTFAIPETPSKHWRAKVKKYNNYLKGTPVSPGIASGVRVRVMRRDPKKLAKLQEEVGQGSLPGLKYAWVVSAIDPQTGEPFPVEVIDHKKAPNEIIIHGNSFRTVLFNKSALARQPDDELARVVSLLLRHVPRDEDGEPAVLYSIRIANGPWMIGDRFLESNVGQAVKRLMSTYSQNSSYVARDPHRNYQQWLNGLTLEIAGNQRSRRELDAARERQRSIYRVVRTLKVQWLGILDAMRKGARNVEAIARKYAGDAEDAGTRLALKAMSGKKLVVGDDDRWDTTPQGARYLTRGAEVVNLWNRTSER